MVAGASRFVVEHQIQNVFFSPRSPLRNNAMLSKKSIYFYDERLIPLTTIFLPNFSLAKHGPIAIVETFWIDRGRLGFDISHNTRTCLLHHQLRSIVQCQPRGEKHVLDLMFHNKTTCTSTDVYCGNGSEGLGKCSSIMIKDKVRVTGVPSEYFQMSQVDASLGSITVVSSNESLPTPVDIPLNSGSINSPETFEHVEGMLIRFPYTLVVSDFYTLARFGDIVLTKGSSRPYQFTHENNPDAGGYATYLISLAEQRIILDDDSNVQNPAIAGATDKPYAYPTAQGGFPNGGLSLTNKMRGGDTIENLTGVMHWSWAGASGTDAWRIRPVQGMEYTFTNVNVAPTTPQDMGGSLKVASFNVLNYFTTLNVRGANSIMEIDRQRSKIVAALLGLNADILGLIEIENSIEDEATLDLVDALNNAFGAGTYDFVKTGAIGTDQIKCAFLYKTTTVQLVGDYVVLDSSVDSRFIDDKNRPVLIQTFEEISSGGKLTIAVNHFKSKGSSCDSIGDPNLNDGQGNCPGTRANAALALADYLEIDPTRSGDPDILIIGDLNAYKNDDAITTLIARGYTDLTEEFGGPNAYGYVFDGQLGYLDHALANGSLLSQVTYITDWHVNADEMSLFDYNDCLLDGNEQSFRRKSCANGDLYSEDAIRSSDHDPVLIGFDLTTSPASSTIQYSTLGANMILMIQIFMCSLMCLVIK